MSDAARIKELEAELETAREQLEQKSALIARMRVTNICQRKDLVACRAEVNRVQRLLFDFQARIAAELEPTGHATLESLVQEYEWLSDWAEFEGEEETEEGASA